LFAGNRGAEAIENYQKAIGLNPGNPGIRLDFARALARIGRTNEAVAQAGEALRLKPDYPDARNLLLDLGADR